MPKVKPRKLSYGELQQLKRLRAFEKRRSAKLQARYQPTATSLYRPSLGSSGEFIEWSRDNEGV